MPSEGGRGRLMFGFKISRRHFENPAVQSLKEAGLPDKLLLVFLIPGKSLLAAVSVSRLQWILLSGVSEFW